MLAHTTFWLMLHKATWSISFIFSFIPLFLHKHIIILQSQVPGPGTYGQGGIPSAVVEEKERKSISNVGMLDSGKSYKRQLPEVVHMFICYRNYKKLKYEICSASIQKFIPLHPC